MTKFNSFKLGIKKGWNTPTLPPYLIKLQLHPLIRIFRVISGISLLLVLNHKINYFHIVGVYFAFVILFFYFFYIIFITYNRIKYMKLVIKNKELNIRNSPLNKLASLVGKLNYCGKGFCDNIAPVGIVLGVMASFDTILEHKGKEPIFLPYIADTILPDTEQNFINSPLEPGDTKILIEKLNEVLMLDYIIIYLLVMLLIILICKLLISNNIKFKRLNKYPLGTYINTFLIKYISTWQSASNIWIFFIVISLIIFNSVIFLALYKIIQFLSLK